MHLYKRFLVLFIALSMLFVGSVSAFAESDENFYTLSVENLKHKALNVSQSLKITSADFSINSPEGTQQFYVELKLAGELSLGEFDQGTRELFLAFDLDNNSEADTWVTTKNHVDGEESSFLDGGTSVPILNVLSPTGEGIDTNYCSDIYHGFDSEKSTYYLVLNTDCLPDYENKIQIFASILSNEVIVDSVTGDPISALWVDRVDCKGENKPLNGVLIENDTYFVCYKGVFLDDLTYKATLMSEGLIFSKKKKITDPFLLAYYKCLYKEPYASLTDKNRTLLIDGAAKDDHPNTISLYQLSCVYKSVSAPSAVIAMISHTRALDGMKSTTFGKYKIAWSYHPDSGINLILQKK